MKRTKRLAIFVLIGFLSFVIGLSLTQLRAFLRPEASEPSPWQVLLSFENQDLEGLNDASRSKVRQAIMAVTNQQDSAASDRFRPALFKLMSNKSGEERYILIEEAPLLTVPAESRLRIYVFDKCGRLLSRDVAGRLSFEPTTTALQ